MALPNPSLVRDTGHMRTAETLITGPAIEVWPDLTLRDLAQLLEENAIGAVLVRASDGGIAGVISERDLVRAIAEGADPDVERVGDHMTFEVEFVAADTTVADLAQTMVDDAIRHLPVTEEDGKVIGVLSIRDVLSALRSP
jgi:CBS domain-containing protein